MPFTCKKDSVIDYRSEKADLFMTLAAHLKKKHVNKKKGLEMWDGVICGFDL